MLINPFDFGQRHLNYVIMIAILLAGLGIGYITGRTIGYKNEISSVSVAVKKNPRLGKMILSYPNTNIVWTFDLDK